jgi:formylglycine-generating enzyme required for sulfatase activity
MNCRKAPVSARIVCLIAVIPLALAGTFSIAAAGSPPQQPSASASDASVASVPGQSRPVSPAAGTATVMPTYIWTASVGATWYQLWVSDSSGATKIQTWYTASKAGCGSGSWNCAVYPSTKLDSGAYQWWVQTWGQGGAGPWSDGMSFTVASPAVGPYGIEFMTLPAGEFMMGKDTHPNYLTDGWLHRVVISRSLEMGKCEVTQAQWKAALGSNPSFNKGDTLPVENVSWDEAQQFIDRLNFAADGFKYRMPTEAEWEYACRAGTTGEYVGYLDEMAWYEKNSGNTTHPVGQKKSNAFGFHDMLGNVREMLLDWYDSQYYMTSALTDPLGPSTGTYKVVRGGCFSSAATADELRPTFRTSGNFIGTSDRSSSRGFRVVRTPQ